ncbi:MAG: DUF3093 domain-containing protein [Candidatus Planktophila sp.]
MSSTTAFREVIRPPIWLIAFIYFMLFSLVIAIWAAFDNNAAINAFAISIVLGAVAIYRMTSTIEIKDGELHIGKAHIPVQYLSDVEIIAQKDFSFQRTRGADPAAYFATTFWVSEGVKVKVTDQRDPTPYWLISTKKAEQLAAALQS